MRNRVIFVVFCLSSLIIGVSGMTESDPRLRERPHCSILYNYDTIQKEEYFEGSSSTIDDHSDIEKIDISQFLRKISFASENLEELRLINDELKHIIVNLERDNENLERDIESKTQEQEKIVHTNRILNEEDGVLRSSLQSADEIKAEKKNKLYRAHEKNLELKEQRGRLVDEGNKLEGVNREKVQIIGNLKATLDQQNEMISVLQKKERELRRELDEKEQKPVDIIKRLKKRQLQTSLKAEAWKEVIRYGLDITEKININYELKGSEFLDELIIDILSRINEEVLLRNERIKTLQCHIEQDKEEISSLKELLIGQNNEGLFEYSVTEDDISGSITIDNVDDSEILSNLRDSKVATEYIDRSLLEISLSFDEREEGLTEGVSSSLRIENESSLVNGKDETNGLQYSEEEIVSSHNSIISADDLESEIIQNTDTEIIDIDEGSFVFDENGSVSDVSEKDEEPEILHFNENSFSLIENNILDVTEPTTDIEKELRESEYLINCLLKMKKDRRELLQKEGLFTEESIQRIIIQNRELKERNTYINRLLQSCTYEISRLEKETSKMTEINIDLVKDNIKLQKQNEILDEYIRAEDDVCTELQQKIVTLNGVIEDLGNKIQEIELKFDEEQESQIKTNFFASNREENSEEHKMWINVCRYGLSIINRIDKQQIVASTSENMTEQFVDGRDNGFCDELIKSIFDILYGKIVRKSSHIQLLEEKLLQNEEVIERLRNRLWDEETHGSVNTLFDEMKRADSDEDHQLEEEKEQIGLIERPLEILQKTVIDSVDRVMEEDVKEGCLSEEMGLSFLMGDRVPFREMDLGRIEGLLKKIKQQEIFDLINMPGEVINNKPLLLLEWRPEEKEEVVEEAIKEEDQIDLIERPLEILQKTVIDSVDRVMEEDVKEGCLSEEMGLSFLMEDRVPFREMDLSRIEELLKKIKQQEIFDLINMPGEVINNKPLLLLEWRPEEKEEVVEEAIKEEDQIDLIERSLETLQETVIDSVDRVMDVEEDCSSKEIGFEFLMSDGVHFREMDLSRIEELLKKIKQQEIFNLINIPNELVNNRPRLLLEWHPEENGDPEVIQEPIREELNILEEYDTDTDTVINEEELPKGNINYRQERRLELNVPEIIGEELNAVRGDPEFDEETVINDEEQFVAIAATSDIEENFVVERFGSERSGIVDGRNEINNREFGNNQYLLEKENFRFKEILNGKENSFNQGDLYERLSSNDMSDLRDQSLMDVLSFKAKSSNRENTEQRFSYSGYNNINKSLGYLQVWAPCVYARTVKFGLGNTSSGGILVGDVLRKHKGGFSPGVLSWIILFPCIRHLRRRYFMHQL